MNSLSVIIYVISLIDSVSYPLRIVLGWSIFFVVITTVAMLVSNTLLRSLAGAGDDASKVWMDNGYVYVRKMFRASLAVMICTLVVLIVIPDKKYAVMIAASEIGERFMKTDEAQKIATDVTGLSGDATELLRQYIKQQTEEIKKQLAAEAAPAPEKKQ